MKKLYALCLLTLAAVVLDIVLLHTGSVQAQQPTSGARIDRVIVPDKGMTAPTSGQVVGFSCTSHSSGTSGDYCYIVTVPR
jgi:hypothetical protein